jgi:hypothetical protein
MEHIARSDADFVSKDAALEDGAESARALAIIGMGLGIAGLTCLPIRAFFEAAPRHSEGAPAAGYITVVFPLVGLLLSALLVAGSLGAFNLRSWARPLLLTYAVATLIAGAASLAFYAWDIASHHRGLFVRGGGVAFTFELIGWPIAMAFSIYLLFAMTRGKVRRALVRGPDDRELNTPAT